METPERPNIRAWQPTPESTCARFCRWAPSLVFLVLAALSAPAASAQTVTATVPAGPGAFAIAVNSVTNKVYVVNDTTSGTVTVIDGTTNATTSIPVGSGPQALDVNPVTNKIYVANGADGTVSVIDGSTNAVVATVKTGVNPQQVVVNSKANIVYVMNGSLDGTETVIDGGTNAVVDQIFGGDDPSFIAVDPTIDTLYVVATANNDYPSTTTPTLYSAVGLVPDSPIDNGNDTIAELPGTNVYAMAADPVTDQVVAACVNGGGFVVMDNNAQGLAKSYKQFEAGQNYAYAAINAVTGVAYVTNGDFGGTTLDAVNLSTYVDTQIVAGPLALAIAVDPAANVVYVGNDSIPGTVTAIDGVTNATTTIPVGNAPFAIAVNPVTTTVYALNNDAAGTVSVIRGIPAATTPVISAQPQSETVASGATVAFNAAAVGRPVPGYQWTFNGAPLSDGGGISGSTGPTLVLTGVSAANGGTYAVIATNSTGHATSSAATLAVTTAATPGRIINLSTRALIDNGRGVDGAQVLIAGFVIQGTGSKSLVLRGVGPALANFGITGAIGVAGPIQHPDLTLYDSAVPANLITQDLGWQSPPSAPTGIWKGAAAPADATAADFSEVGAFALAPGSADCALKLALPAGAYTGQVTTTDTGNGIVLAEVYDEDTGTPSANLVNISSRGFIGSGVNAMIAGFVISGSTSATVLIRASGPALAALGVDSVATNPNVLLYDANGNLLASNSKWGGNPQIAAAAARVGAFTWTDPTSDDAAVLVTLPPGAYTAEVDPTVNPYGNALIEVYLVP
jgi:YVTN family beta-propeller protein